MAEKHHASCGPNDRSLVWHCGQCGLIEDASELDKRVAALEAGCRAAYEHTSELRDAWMRGVLDEHDGKGGARSNRNVDVNVKLRALLEKQ
jgi:hypothetical protein